MAILANNAVGLTPFEERGADRRRTVVVAFPMENE
jgi:hypothetical protein